MKLGHISLILNGVLVIGFILLSYFFYNKLEARIKAELRKELQKEVSNFKDSISVSKDNVVKMDSVFSKEVLDIKKQMVELWNIRRMTWNEVQEAEKKAVQEVENRKQIGNTLMDW